MGFFAGIHVLFYSILMGDFFLNFTDSSDVTKGLCSCMFVMCVFTSKACLQSATPSALAYTGYAL